MYRFNLTLRASPAAASMISQLSRMYQLLWSWLMSCWLWLQERLFDQSDAYRVHVCESCGLFAVANLKKNQFHCPACKNTTGIVQVGLAEPSWQTPLLEAK